MFVVNASHDITFTGTDFAISANYVTITGNVFRLRPTASSVGDYGSSHVTVRDNTTVPLL